MSASKALPSASSRDRILRVAKRLFAAKGFEHASTAEIARTAATSESQLMKHFGSKHGLLEAIFTAGWNQITEQARREIATLPVPEKMGALTQTVVRALQRDSDLQQLILLEGRRMRKEGRGVTLTQGFLSFVCLVDSVLYEMQGTGLLRPDLHPQAVRSALMGMLEGLLRDHYLSQRFGYPAAYALPEVQRMLAVVMDCLRPLS